LVLASASPARLALLRAGGFTPRVLVSGVDEDAVEAALGPDAAPSDVALELARAKARAVAALPETDGALVVGCDSILEFEGQALGKPADAEEAVARWYAMRGKSGRLLTGHWLVDRAAADGVGDVGKVGAVREVGEVATTVVHFGEPSDEEVLAYVATGEPLLVAGAFTIDGLGGAFVERLEGDHSNVVGLSKPLLRKLMADLGVNYTAYWGAGE
jgi:septum formation protein